MISLDARTDIIGGAVSVVTVIAFDINFCAERNDGRINSDDTLLCECAGVGQTRFVIIAVCRCCDIDIIGIVKAAVLAGNNTADTALQDFIDGSCDGFRGEYLGYLRTRP